MILRPPRFNTSHVILPQYALRFSSPVLANIFLVFRKAGSAKTDEFWGIGPRLGLIRAGPGEFRWGRSFEKGDFAHAGFIGTIRGPPIPGLARRNSQAPEFVRICTRTSKPTWLDLETTFGVLYKTYLSIKQPNRSIHDAGCRFRSLIRILSSLAHILVNLAFSQ